MTDVELPTRDEGKEKKAGDRSAWHKSLDDIEMIKRKERRKQTATAVYLNQPVCKIDGWNRLVTFDLETSRSTYEGYPQTSLSGISRERERKTGFCRGVSFLEILVSFHRVRVIRRILKLSSSRISKSLQKFVVTNHFLQLFDNSIIFSVCISRD